MGALRRELRAGVVNRSPGLPKEPMASSVRAPLCHISFSLPKRNKGAICCGMAFLINRFSLDEDCQGGRYLHFTALRGLGQEQERQHAGNGSPRDRLPNHPIGHLIPFHVLSRLCWRCRFIDGLEETHRECYSSHHFISRVNIRHARLAEHVPLSAVI